VGGSLTNPPVNRAASGRLFVAFYSRFVLCDGTFRVWNVIKFRAGCKFAM
jgi:hypothetical protein